MNVTTRFFSGMKLAEVTIADKREAHLTYVKVGKHNPVGLLSYDADREVYVFDIYIDGPFTVKAVAEWLQSEVA